MSAGPIIACAISVTAAIVAVLGAVMAYRARLAARSDERCGTLKPTFFANSQPAECVLRPQHTGSHADEHGTRWRFIPVAAEDGTVCEAYRLPTTAEGSGLCSRCGMYDYKHQEQPSA